MAAMSVNGTRTKMTNLGFDGERFSSSLSYFSIMVEHRGCSWERVKIDIFEAFFSKKV